MSTPSSPLISFVIPTWNRAQYLERCLASIIDQEPAVFEIVISDNHSDDETESVLNKFKNRPNIRCYVNTSNLGGEVNLHKVLSYASGTYVFVLTDDDYLLPRAVAALVAFLVKYSTCGVVLSPLLNEDDRVNRITGAAFAVERDTVYGAGEAALSNLFWECHILSRLVVRRDLIDLEAFRCEFGRHLYTYIVVPALAMKQAPAGKLSTPLVVHTCNNKVSWTHTSDYSNSGLLEVIRTVVRGERYEQSVFDRLVKERVKYSFCQLYDARCRSSRTFFSVVIAHCRLPEYRRSVLFWSYAIVIGLLGATVVKVLGGGLKKIRCCWLAWRSASTCEFQG